MVETKIISAFPGTGKTFFFNNSKKFVLDSDSSYFDKSKFPQNYIEHIKSYIGKVDFILISSHKEVREALFNSNVRFELIIPNINLKDEYLKRYSERGSAETFLNLLNDNWDFWINDCRDQEGCYQYELQKGEFISDIINII